jgi:hypothetical protein
VIPSCYGASARACTAGAVDRPGVRRAHGARTAPQRRGSRRLGQGDALGGGASSGTRPRAERRWEGARGTTVEGNCAIVISINLETKSNVFGPEEHPRSAMVMVLISRVSYKFLMAFSIIGILSSKIIS